MTRYDPFAKSPAKSDATRVAPPRQEEDMLFATGEPVKQAPPADSGWEVPDEDVDRRLSNAGALPDAELFATEILGEEAPAPAQKARPQRATESPKATQPQSTQPMSTQAKPTQPKSTQPKSTQTKSTQPTSTQAKPTPPKQVTPAPRATPVPQVAVRTLSAAEAQPPAEQPAKTSLVPITPARPMRHRASKHAPAIVFGVGASIAAWLGVMQRNYVLGTIVGCATIVGVVFAWLWKRG